MANASSGEPLGLRHGVVLYSAQAAYGTPVTPATSCGNAMVGWTRHSSNQSFYGPGSANRRAVKGGETYTEWQIRYDAVQSGIKTLLTKAARSGGVLPLVTLGFGYSDDQGAPNRSADQIQDVKIGSLRLGLDASGGHAPLTAELSGVGGLVTALTTLAPATLITTPWYSYEGVFTRGGSAYELRSFELNVEHNLSRDHVIPGAAPASFLRGHKYLTEHNEVISGSISRYQRSGVSVQADAISTFAMQLVLTNQVDAAELTIALTDCDFISERTDEDENGVFWSAEFQATSWSVS